MIKRFVTILVLIVISSFIAVSLAVEIDYKSLSDEELQQIYDAIGEEIKSRKNDSVKTPAEMQIETTEKDAAVMHLITKETKVITTTDELVDWINNDVEKTIAYLQTKWDNLNRITTNYDEYKKNIGAFQELYADIDTSILKICLRMKYYAFAYAVIELNSGKSNDDIYEDLNDMYDVIYEDARDDIYSDIYEDLLEDMYKKIYDGILDKAYDYVPYEEWDNYRSEEYSMWDETRSSVYGNWDGSFSNIYSFWDSLRSNIYNDENDSACKSAIRFYRRITKDGKKNNLDVINITGIYVDADKILNMNFKPTLVDGIDEKVDADLEATLSTLEKEWDELAAQTETYEKYVSYTDQIEDYFEKIENTTEELCIRQQQYAIDYANVILQSDSQTKYRDLTHLYSSIYGGTRGEIYQVTYNGILKDMYKYYYNGVLKKAKNTVSYSEWIGKRSDMYSQWIDSRSNVYSTWIDTFSDIYSFYSDLRSSVYDKDMEKAQKVIDKFQKKTDRMKK